MPLTEEQRFVVGSDAPILKVNAVAGSGKTTTLLEFAAHHPRFKILYLAYNKSVAVEMRDKGQGTGPWQPDGLHNPCACLPPCQWTQLRTGK